MCDALIKAALSEGGRGGGCSGISRSWTDAPRGGAAIAGGADAGADAAAAAAALAGPGPGGGSLGRLHADSASAQSSDDTRRTDDMRLRVATWEARVNSRG